MELLNWDPSKGNPFDYEIDSYRDIVSNGPEWIIEPLPDALGHCIGRITYDLHLKTLATLQVHQLSVIALGETSQKVDKALNKHVKINLPLTVWLDYPFNNSVKATIYPLVRIWGLKTPVSTGLSKHIVSDFNYYVWQIATVYADIYKNNHESVGIYLHSFDDLYLEEVEVYKGNIIRLSIGS